MVNFTRNGITTLVNDNKIHVFIIIIIHIIIYLACQLGQKHIEIFELHGVKMWLLI